MFFPSALKPHIVSKAKQLANSAITGQFSGVVATELQSSLNKSSQIPSQTFLSYLVDVDNTLFVPSSGTTGSSMKAYFLPGRIIHNFTSTNETLGVGSYDVAADYLLTAMPDKWFPTTYPKGNYPDVNNATSGQWPTYEWQPFNTNQRLYHIANNSEYICPNGAYVFRNERLILIKLGCVQTGTTNYNFTFSPSVMTYDSNPTRIRSGGLDKNVIINYIRTLNQVDQTTIV